VRTDFVHSPTKGPRRARVEVERFFQSPRAATPHDAATPRRRRMNIIKKPTALTTTPMSSWEPFRMLRDMMLQDPFREMGWPNLAEPTGPISFNPTFEVRENGEGYFFRADVPGVKEADLEVSMQGNRVTINGKRETEKADERDKFYVFERSYGAFTRSFTLPDGVEADKAKAELKDGVLTLFLPRKAALQAKRLHVTKA
jgi:HSP20 family protein